MEPLFISLLLRPSVRLNEQRLQTTLGDSLGGFIDNIGHSGFGYGWGVGAVAGSETLIQSRPVFRGAPSDFAKALLSPASEAAIGMLAQRKGPASRLPNMARFHRWICLAICPELEDRTSTIRSDFDRFFSNNFPEFIKRSQDGTSPSELLMFATLSILHERQQLGAVHSSTEEILNALDVVVEQLALRTTPCDFVLLDGQTMAGCFRFPTHVTRLDPQTSAGVPPHADNQPSLPAAGALLVSGGSDLSPREDCPTIAPHQTWASSIHDPAAVITPQGPAF